LNFGIRSIPPDLIDSLPGQLYINDITDSGLPFCVGSHSIDLVKALDIISEWANMWQLKIATNKCVAHRISAKCHLSSNNCP